MNIKRIYEKKLEILNSNPLLRAMRSRNTNITGLWSTYIQRTTKVHISENEQCTYWYSSVAINVNCYLKHYNRLFYLKKKYDSNKLSNFMTRVVGTSFFLRRRIKQQITHTLLGAGFELLYNKLF